MSIANRILKVIYDTPQSIKQINTRISELPETTIYGRISELKTRKLVKKIGGKFVITEKGKTYLDKTTEKYVFKEQVEYNYEIGIRDTITRIYAKNDQQAYELAKVIYGSKVEIKYIE